MAAVRDRLAQVPAATVVANHAMGLYELGAIHLSQDPPSFSEATIAIDAMAALIDRLPGRLGDDEATLARVVGPAAHGLRHAAETEPRRRRHADAVLSPT